MERASGAGVGGKHDPSQAANLQNKFPHERRIHSDSRHC